MKTQWFNPRDDKPKHNQAVLLLMMVPVPKGCQSNSKGEVMYVPSLYFDRKHVKGFMYLDKQMIVDERYIMLWAPIDEPDEEMANKAFEQALAETKRDRKPNLRVLK